MASCQEDTVPTPAEPAVQVTETQSAEPEPEPISVSVSVEVATAAPVQSSATPPLAKAIEDEERKAAAKYGNMKKKQSDVMRKRMMGGGKQYFDSGDHALGKFRPNAAPITPEHAQAPEQMRNRKASIPNKLLSRLS